MRKCFVLDLSMKSSATMTGKVPTLPLTCSGSLCSFKRSWVYLVFLTLTCLPRCRKLRLGHTNVGMCFTTVILKWVELNVAVSKLLVPTRWSIVAIRNWVSKPSPCLCKRLNILKSSIWHCCLFTNVMLDLDGIFALIFNVIVKHVLWNHPCLKFWSIWIAVLPIFVASF